MISHEHQRTLNFGQIPEGVEEEKPVAAEKAETKGEFQGEWTALAPKFTAIQPEVTDGSEEAQVPSVRGQWFPTEDGSTPPAAETWPPNGLMKQPPYCELAYGEATGNGRMPLTNSQ
ncbi:40S ribosomal protein SA-like [Zalophus californianus]|uniref:40S ribosomal protein SA-like n=1 Tax=Zalophus californianus TaxID=9704 RepID=A0A6P9F9K4_ZALCA|nr:40S ribosomal protein SA-like [Zalophus californianus]